ncbi:hypothetical protein K439DRAFT_1628051 [Ramaria rubella]|nr:hypothetical protein K439DRAFT_1628051 [Ramaria rubella]
MNVICLNTECLGDPVRVIDVPTKDATPICLLEDRIEGLNIVIISSTQGWAVSTSSTQ